MESVNLTPAIKEAEENIKKILSHLPYKERDVVINNIRMEARDSRMKEIHCLEDRIHEIRRTLDKV